MPKKSLPKITEIDELKGRYVFLRTSLNVPIENGEVRNQFRLMRGLPTINYLRERGARIVLGAHIGRERHETLKPVLNVLKNHMQFVFSKEMTGPSAKALRDELKNGGVLFLENLRQDPREQKNDANFARELADLADIYVNDAFSVSHREHASIVGITKYLPSYAGLNFIHECEELEKARKHLSLDSCGRNWRAGISPHAPYSVHPELFAKLIAEAGNSDASVAFHLAESREELQLLHEGTGPFRELLTDLGAWDPSAIPGGTRPLDYLRRLADAPRSLIIHGNYLDEEEIALLAAHAETMSLIYCPRTHAYFGHDRYPMEKLLDAGASVALGTDSRASNPDLSVLAEIRHVARQGAVPLSTVLRLGTMNGAKALGQDHETGSLSPGKIADFCIVALPDADAADPHELLLHDDSPSIATWRRGDVVWSVESI